MGVRFCVRENGQIYQVDGHFMIIEVEDTEEITQWRLMEKKKKMKDLKRKEIAAIWIQAWWRGTLVRRTLLHMALRAWIIQCWWRLTLLKLLERKRREALLVYAQRERAVIKLQSLVRMWRVHWRYRQVLNAIYVIQCHWQCHNCQTCALLRGHCVVTATHLQFHIEIINS
ncbi:IQ domain-containing protein F2 isoform X1 [Oryctolagus cuniculus]|uniref:IQ domain-containing protein F2 isoform X1 n=2 Tax=Oryctolagus cuniculus TaxID=9986 RepID=UPI00048B1594|nr:IQ domain-containing protein F2-like isoform X1 [Oryctolagus cuniculus]